MTTEITEAIPESLEATVEEYHRTLCDRVVDTGDIARFYALGALVVQIDGRLLTAKGLPPREGTGMMRNFWIQRLYFQHSFKAFMQTVELRISNDSAHEICLFHWNFSLPGYPPQVIEEGHYLAVWNYSPEDQRWLITAQAFSSADTELSSALDELHPEYQFKEWQAPSA